MLPQQPAQKTGKSQHLFDRKQKNKKQKYPQQNIQNPLLDNRRLALMPFSFPVFFCHNAAF
jgi:hypothetical protein